MNPTTRLVTSVLLSAAVGAGVATVVTLALFDGGEQSGEFARADAGAPTLDAAGLAAGSLEALATRIAALEKRLARLELAPSDATERAPVDGVTRAEFDALVRELARLRGGSDASESASPERIPGKVDTKVEEFSDDTERRSVAVRSAEDVAAIIEAKRQRRIDDEAAQWDKWLDLDDFQGQSLRGALVDRDARRAERERLGSKGADAEFLADLAAADHAAFLADLEAFLTPEQLEAVESKSTGAPTPVDKPIRSF